MGHRTPCTSPPPLLLLTPPRSLFSLPPLPDPSKARRSVVSTERVSPRRTMLWAKMSTDMWDGGM